MLHHHLVPWLTSSPSTANRSIISREKSVGMPTSHHVENFTHERSPLSSPNLFHLMSPLQSGPPPFVVPSKLPASSPRPTRTIRSSNGRPWTNSTRASATVSHTKKSPNATPRISRPATRTSTTTATGAANRTAMSSSDWSLSSWSWRGVKM